MCECFDIVRFRGGGGGNVLVMRDVSDIEVTERRGSVLTCLVVWLPGCRGLALGQVKPIYLPWKLLPSSTWYSF